MEQKTWKSILYREGRQQVATPAALALKGNVGVGGRCYVSEVTGDLIVFPRPFGTTQWEVTSDSKSINQTFEKLLQTLNQSSNQTFVL